MSPAEEEGHELPRSLKIKRAVLWLIAYWLLLITLTHWPNPWPPGGEPPRYDKIAHFTLYSVLAVLALRVVTLRSTSLSAVVRWIAILATVTAFGLCDEATQPWTHRDFDWFDWLADILGATTGIAVYEWFRARRK